MDVTIYTVEDENGEEAAAGFWWPFEINDAYEYARKYNLRLIANEYEFADSYMIEDYTVQEDTDD